MGKLDRLHWFNHQRLLESTGYITPAETEDNCYRHLPDQALAA